MSGDNGENGRGVRGDGTSRDATRLGNALNDPSYGLTNEEREEIRESLLKIARNGQSESAKIKAARALMQADKIDREDARGDPPPPDGSQALADRLDAIRRQRVITQNERN